MRKYIFWNMTDERTKMNPKWQHDINFFGEMSIAIKFMVRTTYSKSISKKQMGIFVYIVSFNNVGNVSEQHDQKIWNFIKNQGCILKNYQTRSLEKLF